MTDAVTILHVGDPVMHAASALALPTRVTADWHLLHAGSPMHPGTWYVLALPAPARLAALGTRQERSGALAAMIEQVGFTAVTVGYLDDADDWPLELPCPGYVQPASGVGGAIVQSVLRPQPARVTARGVWSGAATALGQIGLDPHTMVLHYAPHEVQPRSGDGAAALLPGGLWMAPGPDGQAMGNSPSEVAAKLAM